ncbi:hypothetical protein ScPMuIL_009215 [Solemya velum]
MVVHFIAVLFTAFIIYTAWPGSSLFSWHPTLMAIAFVFLMFEGLLVFSPESSLLHRSPNLTKIKFHWLVQGAAVTCALGGFLVIYANKNVYDKPHFLTWHGYMGVITIIFLCMQSIGGTFAKYPALAKAIGMRLSEIRLYHATSGAVTFTLVCLSLMLGLYTDWFSTNVTGTAWYGCLGCVSCMGLTIMNQIASKYVKKSQKNTSSTSKSE